MDKNDIALIIGEIKGQFQIIKEEMRSLIIENNGVHEKLDNRIRLIEDWRLKVVTKVGLISTFVSVISSVVFLYIKDWISR